MGRENTNKNSKNLLFSRYKNQKEWLKTFHFFLYLDVYKQFKQLGSRDVPKNVIDEYKPIEWKGKVIEPYLFYISIKSPFWIRNQLNQCSDLRLGSIRSFVLGDWKMF